MHHHISNYLGMILFPLIIIQNVDQRGRTYLMILFRSLIPIKDIEYIYVNNVYIDI